MLPNAGPVAKAGGAGRARPGAADAALGQRLTIVASYAGCAPGYLAACQMVGGTEDAERAGTVAMATGDLRVPW